MADILAFRDSRFDTARSTFDAICEPAASITPDPNDDNMALLTDALHQQENLVAKVSDIMKFIPSSQEKTTLLRQMLLIRLQIAQAFAACQVTKRSTPR